MSLATGIQRTWQRGAGATAARLTQIRRLGDQNSLPSFLDHTLDFTACGYKAKGQVEPSHTLFVHFNFASGF